jgi:hypothetical protein
MNTYIVLPGLILLALVVAFIVSLVKPSKNKRKQAEDLRRIADSLEEAAKPKRQDNGK